MKARTLFPLGLAAAALAVLPFAAKAQGRMEPAAAAPASSVPGWGEFVESLRTLPDRMLAKLPEAIRTDPHQRQEVA